MPNDGIWYPNVPEPHEAILAVDPGLVSGWSVWTEGYANFGQTEGHINFLKQADEVIFRYRPTIVIEKFTISAHTTTLSPQYEPLWIIGAMQWFAEEYKVPYFEQTPAQAKSFGTDDKLAAMDWIKPTAGNGGHSRDAARHLVRHLAVERKHTDTILKLVDAIDYQG